MGALILLGVSGVVAAVVAGDAELARSMGDLVGRFAPFAGGGGALAMYFLRAGKKPLAWSIAACLAVLLSIIPGITLVRLVLGRETTMVEPPREPLLLTRGPSGTQLQHPTLGFQLILPPSFEPDTSMAALIGSSFGQNAYGEAFRSDDAAALVMIAPAIATDGVDDFVRGTEDALRDSAPGAALERSGSGYDAEVRYQAVVQGAPVLARVVFVRTPGHVDRMTPVAVQIIGMEPAEAQRITVTLRE